MTQQQCYNSEIKDLIHQQDWEHQQRRRRNFIVGVMAFTTGKWHAEKCQKQKEAHKTNTTFYNRNGGSNEVSSTRNN
eukprot:7382178-Ditylum_brightwellii.AAC.1